ncbi:MAG: hypothetical protein ACK5PS_12825 [Desulfopila sp.]
MTMFFSGLSVLPLLLRFSLAFVENQRLLTTAAKIPFEYAIKKTGTFFVYLSSRSETPPRAIPPVISARLEGTRQPPALSTPGKQAVYQSVEDDFHRQGIDSVIARKK